MKGSSRNVKGRFINIIICSLQCLSSLSTYACLIVNLGQETNLKLIIKTFVALGFIITIDDKFANTVPAEVWENARNLNSELIRKKFLKMGIDNNSYSKIWKEVT